MSMSAIQLKAITEFAYAGHTYQSRLLAQEYACALIPWKTYCKLVPAKIRVSDTNYLRFLAAEKK